MARNKYDVDEQLETPFDIRHFKRAAVYVKKYKGKMILALFLSAAAVIIGLFAPVLTQYAIDNSMANKNIPELIVVAALLLVTIIVNILFTTWRSRIMS